MTKIPDFWISAAGEFRGDLALPRACYFEAVVANMFSRQCMLVRVEPPVIGQPYGLGAEDIHRLLLSERYGTSLSIERLAVQTHVFVYRILDQSDAAAARLSSESQVVMIAWAAIFRHHADAIALYEQFRGK